MGLTVVILTQNEAKSIQRAISSVKWADEILLVDNSSDQTVDLAIQAVFPKKIHVLRHIEVNNFAKLRNFALTKAKYEWVLFIDADEEVSSSLKNEIQIAIANPKYSGYYLKRRDFFLGRWLNYGETSHVRLLKLGKKTSGKWMRAVHEIWQIKGNISELKQPLLHYPHPTLAEFLAHINRWTSLDAQEFSDQGITSNWWKILVYPTGKFIQNYFLSLGFLDGMPGLINAMMMSFHSFLTRAKLYLHQS